MDDDFRKQRSDAPAGFFAAEAAGLAWLAEPRAVPVVEVRAVAEDGLRLEHLASAAPTAQAARRFGADLARLHDAGPGGTSGERGFGWAPSETAWFGPLEAPFPVSTTPRRTHAEYLAEDRLRPLAEACASQLGAGGREAVDRAIDVIADGAFDGIAGQGTEPPSRVHGDLWSGNVMWTPAGATLIDPAAHAGHRLEDLALLTLFGAPHLDEILAGYEQQHPMPRTWREDLPAHLFFALLAHVRLFGGGYGAQAVATAKRIVRRAAELGGGRGTMDA